MKEIILSLFLLGGSFFIFIAALGIFRLPDLYTRMHAGTKASSLGVGLFAIAAGIYFFQFWVLVEALFIIIFIFLTTPVSAHMIGRAGYFMKAHIWRGTVANELENRYDLKNLILHSHRPADENK